MDFENIPREKFEFADQGDISHDKKLETKARGFFFDALLRFRKNKSSVIAAWIIGLLILFAFLSPLISPYSVYEQNNTYTSFPPYVESIAEKNLGILDGGMTLQSQNERQMTLLRAIGQETGMNPIIKTLGYTETFQKVRGKDVAVRSYSVRVNRYYLVGVTSRVIGYEDFKKIQQFQNETGIQVLYPAVLQKDIYGSLDTTQLNMVKADANIWFQCSDIKGTAKLDSNGNLIPAYCTDASEAGPEPYESIRIAGDDGSYIYSIGKSGSLQVRVCYYNYYQFLQWNSSAKHAFHEPRFLFGTTSLGQDLFCAIGVGARFSLVFALVVSAINLSIGAVYGAIQGYYGGVIDLTMDRISDILSGIPGIVVVTLFQLHLAKTSMGSVGAFLLAFIMTGWISMAALTRKQFYRFKSQEFVYAAKTLGASDWRLMFKHIFPNAMGTIITSCALVIPGVISSETSLTYLGIIDLSSFVGTSIGTLMQQGQTSMTTSPHAMFFPAIFFSLLMISFNLFGNGLRDAFNPSTRGVED